uniref:SET domain-containing protein n=1 Tax=Glycine max TaxID=3847 RepID=A0A0R0E3N4_SOYBN
MLIVMVASRSLLRMEQIPGKGRGLVASQLLKAGQILLLSSHPLLHLTLTMTIVLESYLSLTIVLLSQRQVQAHLIVASHNLFLHNHTPSKLHTFLYLHGTPDDAILDAANFLHSLISPLFPPQAQLSVDLIAQLLAKDRLNSFGLMDPYSCNGPQRSIKAYAIYPKATFFNHDCVPNASRFEYVDSTNDDYGHNSTDMILMEDYGFTCGCDRCKIEVNWDGEENNSDLPHVQFLSKYVCERNQYTKSTFPEF